MVTISIGNYSVVKELASGSFGRVYLAQHSLLKNRMVAIKLLRATHLDSPEERESFLQEAHFLAGLKHPYILPFIDFGIHEGFPYLVAEYAPNGTLKERLYRHLPGLLPVEESLTILSQISEALDYAHRQNIVHRDLKPGNILFNAKGEALVADFGLATTLDVASIKQVNNEGTPRYMAPEQFQGIVSKESDQYALGVIAYELFTGHQPFDAPDFFTMGYKKITENPIPPTRYNPSMPAPIEQAILKAIAKNRTDRHANVQAFIAALRTLGVWQAPLAASTSITPIPGPSNPVTSSRETVTPTYTSTVPATGMTAEFPAERTRDTNPLPIARGINPITEETRTPTHSPTVPVSDSSGPVPSSLLEIAQTFPISPTHPMDRSSSGGRSQATQMPMVPISDDDDTAKGSQRSQQIFADSEALHTLLSSTQASTIVPEEQMPTVISHQNDATLPTGEQVPTMALNTGETTRIIAPQSSDDAATQSASGSSAALSPQGQVDLRQEEEVPTYISGTVAAPPTIINKVGTTDTRGQRRKWLIFATALFLVLLLVSGGVLYAMSNSAKPPSPVTQTNSSTTSTGSNPPSAPGASKASNTSTATVTITPASKDLKMTYTIYEVTGTPDASQNQVGGARFLPSSTQSGFRTVNATGQNSSPGTHASGTLEFDNPNSYSFSLGAGTGFTDPHGLVVYTSNGVTVPANGSTTVAAYASPVGTSGNIPAYDFDANYYIPGHSPDVFRVVNTQAFAGGQNSQSYTYVQQSDINSAISSLDAQLQSQAQQAVQSEIASGEQLIGNIQCSSNISPNHNAGDQASSVTASGSVTCSGEVYNPQLASPLAMSLFKQSVTSQLGANYIVVGNVVTTVLQASLSNNGAVALEVQSEGIGVFQFSSAQEQQLAQLIAGKSKADAQTVLLKQAGVHNASINLSGGTDAALPADARNIKFVVVKVSGL